MKRMRMKTRAELTRLSESLKDINTDDFYQEAVMLSQKLNLDLDQQTIKRHLEWLYKKCQSEATKKQPEPELLIDDVDDDIYDDDNFYDSCGSVVDDMSIVKRAYEISMRMFKGNDSLVDFNIFDDAGPNYTIFSVGEDGLRVIRGKYSGMYIHEIDTQKWKGSAAGWADFVLRQNEMLGADRSGALTKDDIEVLNKIKTNQIVY